MIKFHYLIQLFCFTPSIHQFSTSWQAYNGSRDTPELYFPSPPGGPQDVADGLMSLKCALGLNPDMMPEPRQQLLSEFQLLVSVTSFFWSSVKAHDS